MKRFMALGGAGEIGANSYYLDIEGTGLLLDCGMHPRKEGEEALPKFALIKDAPLDHVLITHAHHDHIGSLPQLVKNFPHVRITSTKQTRDIADVTLRDSAAIQIERNPELAEMLYKPEVVDLLVASVAFRHYREPFDVSGLRHQSPLPLLAEFHDAGHVLGSAGIQVSLGEWRLFYTGDINLERQALLRGAELPAPGVDVLMMESTMGSAESASLPSWDEERKRFARAAETILSGGGSILIPVFAVGKTQELLAVISDLMQRSRIPPMPIYTGGMGKKVSRIYDVNRYVVPRVDPEFMLGDIPQEDLFAVENPATFFKNPCIVLASSGMVVEGTGSFRLAQHWLRNKRGAIFLVGYNDPDTPGYRIGVSHQGGSIRLSPLLDEQTVECRIEKFRFSAHARRPGLLEVVRRLRPKRVVLLHGDTEAIDDLGYEILTLYPDCKVHAPGAGDAIEFAE